MSSTALLILLAPQPQPEPPGPFDGSGSRPLTPTIVDPKVEPIPDTLPEGDPGVVPADGTGGTAA